MTKQGTTMLMEFDGEGWHETQGSIRHRIAAMFGLNKYEIKLQETYEIGGAAQTASFTLRGIGYCVDLELDEISRAPQFDAKPEDDGKADDAQEDAA